MGNIRVHIQIKFGDFIIIYSKVKWLITKETNLSGSMLNYNWINPRNNSADFTFNNYLSKDKYFAKKKRIGETKVIGYK